MLGGGVDDTQAIAREAWRSVPATEAPQLLEQLLVAYLRERKDRETFIDFTSRHSTEELSSLSTPVASSAS